MCEPVTIASAVIAAVGAVVQHQQAKAQVKSIEAQNQVEADEISRQAGVEMGERARAARRERATARAVASEAGINLGGNSFLAALQTSALNQATDQGLILSNESSRQRARQAGANAAASRVNMPNALTAALQIGTAAYGAHVGVQHARAAGVQSAGGVKPPVTTPPYAPPK